MKTRFLLPALLALGAFALRVEAQTPVAATPTSSWVVTPSVVSQYMFRGVRLGGPSFQPSVEFDSGPVAVGVWSNFPIQDKVVGQSDPEVDLYGSYTFELVKDTLTLQPGATYYAYPDADKSAGYYKSTFEPSLALNYTLPADAGYLAGVKLTPKFYYDVVLHGLTSEFNAAYALPLKQLGTELDFTGTVGTFRWTRAVEDADPAVKNWGNYWLVGAAVPFQVSSNSKLTLGFAYTKGTSNFIKQGATPKAENSAAVGRGVVTLAYAMTF